MISYKLVSDYSGNHVYILRGDDWSIPFDPANTDYQKFKLDLENGAELEDPEGNPMTADQITAFLKTLP